jgi:hypothetical protein
MLERRLRKVKKYRDKKEKGSLAQGHRLLREEKKQEPYRLALTQCVSRLD